MLEFKRYTAAKTEIPEIISAQRFTSEMRRTLKDSFLKVRALRARELREVQSSLIFLARFLFYIGTFDYNAFFKYNLSTIIVET